jgi:hypothetical protein
VCHERHLHVDWDITVAAMVRMNADHTARLWLVIQLQTKLERPSSLHELIAKLDPAVLGREARAQVGKGAGERGPAIDLREELGDPYVAGIAQIAWLPGLFGAPRRASRQPEGPPEARSWAA